jgi:hypothetical protein
MTARAIAFRRFELEEGTAFDAEKGGDEDFHRSRNNIVEQRVSPVQAFEGAEGASRVRINQRLAYRHEPSEEETRPSRLLDVTSALWSQFGLARRRSG